ncbi:MAG: hypothetical protein CSA29_04370 [Desulfobacterales bacterium]|nr:MAG: hypothetical protein CSA29_04370 [Desulfobacterales bacterium]
MTTVPGHNQVLQQSSLAQEFSHQAHAQKPAPDQAATIQQAQQVVKNTTIQRSEDAERMKRQNQRKQRPHTISSKAETQKDDTARHDEPLAVTPNARGRLVDIKA